MPRVWSGYWISSRSKASFVFVTLAGSPRNGHASPGSYTTSCRTTSASSSPRLAARVPRVQARTTRRSRTSSEPVAMRSSRCGVYSVSYVRPTTASLSLQPGIAQVSTLAETVRAAGLPVRLELDCAQNEIPAVLELSIYRIVQEALTNARDPGRPRRRPRARPRGHPDDARRERDITVVGEAADGNEALRLVRELDPDVVRMDVRMPNLDGIEATSRVPHTGSNARVLVLTTFDPAAAPSQEHFPKPPPRLPNANSTSSSGSPADARTPKSPPK